MKTALKKLLRMNWVIVGLTVLLAIVGIVAVYSVTASHSDNYWRQQAIWSVAGLVVFLITSLIDYRWVRWGALPIYLLGTVLVLSSYPSWIDGFSSRPDLTWFNAMGRLRPSHWAVVGSILLGAWFLSRFPELHAIEKIAGIGVIFSGPMVATLYEPHLGMALLWVPVALSMLFVVGIPKRYLIALLGALILAAPLVFNFALRPHQRARIRTVFIPDLQILPAPWIDKPLTAVRSGGWDGKGLMATSLDEPNVLPPGFYLHTDFVFTALAEQFGFIGGAALLALFAVLILAMLRTAHQSADQLGLLISIGFATQIVFQVCQNIGSTLALSPMLGLQLPLLSYGNSFLVVTMFGLGMVNSIWVHRGESIDVGSLE